MTDKNDVFDEKQLLQFILERRPLLHSLSVLMRVRLKQQEVRLYLRPFVNDRCHCAMQVDVRESIVTRKPQFMASLRQAEAEERRAGSAFLQLFDCSIEEHIAIGRF